ncbi:MAG: hypothetical protein AAGF46_12690, partial [Pseudomonadota bacterium]
GLGAVVADAVVGPLARVVADVSFRVNEGTGTWGPTMRLGSRSEITLFELSQGSPRGPIIRP